MAAIFGTVDCRKHNFDIDESDVCIKFEVNPLEKERRHCVSSNTGHFVNPSESPTSNVFQIPLRDKCMKFEQDRLRTKEVIACQRIQSNGGHFVGDLGNHGLVKAKFGTPPRYQ